MVVVVVAVVVVVVVVVVVLSHHDHSFVQFVSSVFFWLNDVCMCVCHCFFNCLEMSWNNNNNNHHHHHHHQFLEVVYCTKAWSLM